VGRSAPIVQRSRPGGAVQIARASEQSPGSRTPRSWPRFPPHL